MSTEHKIQEVATLAGGCFWWMEPPFEKLDGVASVVSGFIGGKEPNPTYQQVAHGQTGHTEAVQGPYRRAQQSLETRLQGVKTHQRTQENHE